MDCSMCGRCLSEAVRVFKVENIKEHLEKSNFDSQALLKALSKHISEPVRIPLYVLRKLPNILRKKEYSFFVILGKKENEWKVLEIFNELPENVLGVAIDLGSTTIAFYVYDFLKNKLIKKFSIVNPQVKIGEDILTRLHFARKPENLKYINQITIEAINRELEAIDYKNIYYLSICGNTAMYQFLTNLPVDYLFIEPYTPVTNWYGVLEAKDLNLETHPLAKVFIFPCAGSFLGGDIIAGLYFSEIHKKEDGYYFYIDVGTNAEVILGNKDFLLTCAGAAGPALEGGIFDCGMQAEKGAIETVEIDILQKKIKYQTIGNELPTGICGSGVIDLVAQLFLNGLIFFDGKFSPVFFKERFKKVNDELAFIIAFPEETANKKEIYIKESEIKSFLKSKSAMFSMLYLLCKKTGIEFEDIKNFYIAGSFGNHIKVKSAVMLGMLPEIALERTIGLGNSAGKGALKFLKNANFSEIKDIMEKITYLELNVEPEFMKYFSGAQLIPNVNLEMFPLS
ncbi:MAG: DUF4445 domain-containing protein [Thermodesulfobacterium sp.]|nr:DUF4445 domain-containing protein [Thermodesulfobacterium sp.]